MFDRMLKGIRSYSLALQLVSRYNLWFWVILPGLLALAIGGVVIAWGISAIDPLSTWMASIWSFEWPEWLHWLKTAIEMGTEILAGMIIVILVLYSIKYLAIVLGAPFMGILSERVEARLTGQPVPEASFSQILKDILRGLRLAVRNIVKELFYTLLLTIGGLFIPVVGQIVSAVLIFLIQAYYAGFGNMDFTLERRRYNLKESVNFANSYRWLAVGNGTGFLLLLLIPVVGMVLAPGLGCVAATADTIEAMDDKAYRRRLATA